VQDLEALHAALVLDSADQTTRRVLADRHVDAGDDVMAFGLRWIADRSLRPGLADPIEPPVRGNGRRLSWFWGAIALRLVDFRSVWPGRAGSSWAAIEPAIPLDVYNRLGRCIWRGNRPLYRSRRKAEEAICRALDEAGVRAAADAK
jgi:hypothetical protein